MTKRDYAFKPLLALIIVGAVLVLGGGILMWVSLGLNGQLVSSYSIKMTGFWSAYPLLVPAIALLAHVRRSRPTFVLAIVVSILVLQTLVSDANSSRVVMANWRRAQLQFAASLLQAVGVILSIIPAAVNWKLYVPGWIVHTLIGLIWLAVGIINTQVPLIPLTQALFTTFFIVLAFWTVFTGVTRSKASAIALAVFIATTLPGWFFSVFTIFTPVGLGGESSDKLRAHQAIPVLAIVASVAYLAWVAFDFSYHHVTDRIKHQNKPDRFRLN